MEIRKSVKEWILSIENPEVRTRAIINMNKDRTPKGAILTGRTIEDQDNNLRFQVESLHVAYTFAFDLAYSNEGQTYWIEIIGDVINEFINSKYRF